MHEIEDELEKIIAAVERIHDLMRKSFTPCSVGSLRTLRAREVLAGSVDAAISSADAAIADVHAVLRLVTHGRR